MEEERQKDSSIGTEASTAAGIGSSAGAAAEEEQERVAVVSRVLGVTTVSTALVGRAARTTPTHAPFDATRAAVRATPALQMVLFVISFLLAFSRDLLPPELIGPALEATTT